MGNSNNNATFLERFQNLLKDLFQFDASDLDFGIYRILNHKRKQIDKFITTDLVKNVEDAFSKHKGEKLENIEKELKEAREEIYNNINKNAITLEGELKSEFKDTNIGQKYLKILDRKREIENIDEIKNQVYNDLNIFFSRYYEEGDFIPQYRYSIKGHKYAIPYNGEEVKLYWSSYDQYYTKTGMLFRDYTFKFNNHKVIFRIVAAKEELGSKKATKERFFVLDDENSLEFVDKETLMIRFQYRELTESEVNKYDVAGGSNASKQEKINENIFNELIKKIKDIYWKDPLSQKYKSELPLLQYQLNRFAAKNTKDYFIHKNLKKFLSEQLDYFIKNEVLNIDTLEKERFLDKHITRAKMVREIGEDIIDFLAQIEDFQKRLWEKKKFVLSTDYVITLDKIKEYAGEKFLSDLKETILKNEQQLKEWEELDFGKIEKEEDLYLRKDLLDTEYKKLPLDTKYFPEEFKEQLLENLTKNHNLDDILDGLLIKSENWQALNTILTKYKEQVQTIYIDPPFNTGSDFAYLDKYQNSTWLTLMENRIDIARILLNYKGIICLHLDPRANYYGRIILDDIFGKDLFINEIIWAYEKARYSEKKFKENHENLFLYSKSDDYYFKIQYVPRKGETELTKSLGRHQVDYEGKISPDYWVDIPSFSTAMTAIERSIKLLGIYFETQKPEKLIGRILETTSNETNLVIDFFLGSGTTTAVAQKLGRKWIGIEMGDHFWTVVIPRMKKVLFYDKSGISKEKDVKERYNENKAGGFFKYQILEQYEDTLDNLEINTLDNEQMEVELRDKYLLRYFLEYETRDNPSLLNIDQLKNPFSYKLKVNLEEVGEPEEIVVDLPETFNYLLGLKVKKLKVRNSGRKYLFIDGEKDNNEIAIVWRENDENWEEEDYRKDKDFITEQIRDWSPKVVYINGQSILTRDFKDFRADIRSIESEFKRLMG
ncbi:MAG: DNA methyltransferase [Candidatus Syntrophosphaera sp.]|jgi:adenine-specific DNA-methyltransferase|nr:DNA methyltransferase [Candidatus Syntrophosphaera sp.]